MNWSHILRGGILLPQLFLLSLFTGNAQTLTATAVTSDFGGFNISCNGSNDGVIDVSVSGGTAPYAYQWDSGPTTKDLTGLAAGPYMLVVTDSLGITDTLQVVITQPSDLSVSVFSSSYNGYNISCKGGMDGQISATVGGGVSPYTYQWNTGDSLPDIGGLGTGTYQLVVIDANGCSDTTYITLVEPDALFTDLSSPITGSGLEIDCNGELSGSIDLTVTGGATPFLYNWSNGDITEDLNSVGSDWYSVRVEDANGCVKFDSLELKQPEPLVFTGSAYEYQPGQFFSCDTCNDGQASPMPSGGTPPYSYQWSNGQTTATVTGLAPETMYSFIITDAAGCIVSDSLTLPANAAQTPLEVLATLSSYPGGYQVSSQGAMDGEIRLTIIGGQSPYTISWMHGPSDLELFGLMAGNYEVTVTDDAGQSITKSYYLQEPANNLSVSISNQSNACSGSAYLTAYVNGGVPPYVYEWQGPDVDPSMALWSYLDAYSEGVYPVQVIDANNDTTTASFNVSFSSFYMELSSPLVGGYNVTCGESDGTISIAVHGGMGPFYVKVDGDEHHEFSSGDTLINVDSLKAGTYWIEISDMTGCQTNGEISLTPDPLNISGADWHTYPNGQLFSCDSCNAMMHRSLFHLKEA